jgi:anthranilate phosphoribosyltransferase
MISRALAGEAGPAADRIALTAGTLLWMTGAAADVAEGIEQARGALADGRARALLERTTHPV